MTETKSNTNDQELKRNRPELDGVPDLSQLVYLDMPNVLHNLKHRYCHMQTKFCYTSISSILLAINPYEHLPIYGTDVINQFQTAAEKGRTVQGRPHPYGVSARAYMRMVQRKCNQSVIVCGESGAGKTETTKLLMRYLAMTAPMKISADKPNAGTSSIEEQIVAASPILEAYGNAKTVMNNNSSRFGKFTKLLYSVPAHTQSGNILGSSLETYLLEKSRVVYQALNERNYHIFYFLHEGLGRNNKEYGLQSIDKFNYSNQGKCFAPMKDLERFQELTESLSMFRIEQNVQSVLWKLTAGVLNLGNVNFIRKGDGFADIDKKSMRYVEIVSKLWGLKASDLEKRLTTKSLKVGNNNIVQSIQFSNAVSNRDSIAKGIYENIFLWLCKRINAELLTDDESDSKESEDETYFIGILDVFGFENFYFNSLEQFCINYTNEKLQQYFNFHIIASEQEEYIREGVFWKPLTIPDNRDYITLVEKNKIGFFSLLDSQCTGPSKNDTTAFMQVLMAKHGKNPVLKQKSKPGSGNWRGQKPKGTKRQKFAGFEISHFADAVTYDVSKFLIKNLESVHSDTQKMIKKSNEPIFKEINGDKKRRSKKKKSVTSVFYSGIKRLMKSLNQTEPYFVRCINPNKQRSSVVWNEGIVKHQLRCGGLLEALRVLKLGYPTRVPYKLLHEKYHSSVQNPLIKNMNSEAFSTSLLIAFDVNESDYELGLTKIFFKPSKAAVLDEIMSKAGQPLTAAQNEKITKYIVGKRCQQIIGTVRAFTKLRKLIRMKRAAKEWETKGRIAALLGGTVMKHLFMARKQIRQRKETAGSVAMQSFFRSMYERRSFMKCVSKVKKASKIIWIAYSQMQKRRGMAQKLDALIALRPKIMPKSPVITTVVPKTKQEIIPKAVLENKEPQRDEITKQTSVIEIEEKKAENDRLFREKVESLKERQGSIDANTHESKENSLKKMHDQKAEDGRRNREIADEKAHEVERQKKIAREKKKYRHNSADLTDYASSESEYESEVSDEEVFESVKTALTKFHKLSAMGQLFFRHAGSKTRRKPQDRVVKVSFDRYGKPFEISWGSGSRRIAFRDILYIAWGHWTPVFEVRKDTLAKQKCFSVVAQGGITLDLEGYNERVAELWVRGLRKLLGHNDADSDERAEKNFKNLMYNSKDAKKKRVRDKKQISGIMKLQQDLFIMSTTTVFRHLEDERIWNITDNVRMQFLPKKMYPIALKEDIPWRQWQQWIREQVVTYLRDNNLVIYSNTNTVYNNPYLPTSFENNNDSSGSNKKGMHERVASFVDINQESNTGMAEEEKCTLM